MLTILLLAIVLVLIVAGGVKWAGNRGGGEGQVHNHPIDRDSTM